jgi:hypothetical protein
MEFSIILTRDVDLQRLRVALASSLQRLLNLSSRPHVEISGMEPSLMSLGRSGDAAVFKIDESGEANLMVLELPHDDSAPLSREITAVISAGALRTALSWASAIALAIALGQLMEANIIDDSAVLAGSQEVDPTVLMERIKLDTKHHNLLRASDELLKNIGLL